MLHRCPSTFSLQVQRPELGSHVPKLPAGSQSQGLGGKNQQGKSKPHAPAHPLPAPVRPPLLLLPRPGRCCSLGQDAERSPELNPPPHSPGEGWDGRGGASLHS